MTGSKSHGRHLVPAGRARIPERKRDFPVSFKAVKPRPYGSTKAVVGEAFDQAGGVEHVRVILDLGKTQVYGFTDPEAKGSDLSLDAARRITEITHCRAFACDFAQLAGGVFLTPDSVAEGEALAELGGDISRSMGDLTAELLKAIADGKMTARERADLLRRTDIHTATLVALRAKLMEGDSA